MYTNIPPKKVDPVLFYLLWFYRFLHVARTSIDRYVPPATSEDNEAFLNFESLIHLCTNMNINIPTIIVMHIYMYIRCFIGHRTPRRCFVIESFFYFFLRNRLTHHNEMMMRMRRRRRRRRRRRMMMMIDEDDE